MFRYENEPGKHHYLVAKDIKDAIAKHRAEIIFDRVESQISCATQSAMIVCHAEINDIRVEIHHEIFIYFFISLFLQTDVMKSKFLFFYSKLQLRLNNYLSLFPPFITLYGYPPTELVILHIS